MGKWLAAGGVAIVAILLLLWLQMQSSDPAPVTRAALAQPAPTQVAMAASAPAAAPRQAPAAASAAEPEPPSPEQPAKLDPRSDEFFHKFDDVVPNRLTRNAAKCYEGRHGQLHRNQKLSLRFKTNIVNGEVSIHDVTIKEATVADSALE